MNLISKHSNSGIIFALHESLEGIGILSKNDF